MSMIRKTVLRGLVIVAAIPIGWAAGFPSGYYLCLGILMLQGKGNSHQDMYTVVAAGGLGSLLGALFVPVLAWYLCRGRKNDGRDMS
jgi:hypothetical protein